jgi:cytochrome c-type biogenesis protein CcmH/NrfG
MTLQESIDLLERALSIDPTRRNIHNNLAYAYWEAGKFKNAAEFFRRLLGDSDPETSRVIEERLQQVIDHQKPKNLVYLGPALPRLP